ncbi:MAG: glutamate synthase-related protein [Calditrichia bacterium]
MSLQKRIPAFYETLAQYPELQPFLFYDVIGEQDEPYVSTELKPDFFGVTKETMKSAASGNRLQIAQNGYRRAYSRRKSEQTASYLRGIQGLEKLNIDKLESLINRIEKSRKNAAHPLSEVAKTAKTDLFRSHADEEIYPELKRQIWLIQQKAVEAHDAGTIDPLDFEHICATANRSSAWHTSVISPFLFHNCYSIEDVKSFIDMVRMINLKAVVSVKVSPSVDIEFIAAGLARYRQGQHRRSAERPHRCGAGKTR